MSRPWRRGHTGGSHARPGASRLAGGLLLLLAVMPLTGCGWPESFARGHDGRFEIEMVDQEGFRPASLTVPAGSTVVWINRSTLGHTVTTDPALAANPSHAQSPGGVQPWDSGLIYHRETWQIDLDTPGTYVYFCQRHEDEHMFATIVVE